MILHMQDEEAKEAKAKWRINPVDYEWRKEHGVWWLAAACEPHLLSARYAIERIKVDQ